MAQMVSHGTPAYGVAKLGGLREAPIAWISRLCHVLENGKEDEEFCG
jgi:hypothetical protein